jgi:glutamate--cysteine ligase
MTVQSSLTRLLRERSPEVEDWLAEKCQKCSRQFYSSVDLRHSGYKLAPVDTNLFPAGFNNLSPAARVRASELARGFLRRCYPEARRIALIPENHTRNVYYADNLAALLALLAEAGYETALARVEEGADAPVELITGTGAALRSVPLAREGDRVRTQDGFLPDLLLVNNDFTSGVPELLREIAQPIVPPPGMGWHRRRKSEHFASYTRLATEFCGAFGLDSWMITTRVSHCGSVDFRAQGGLECVARQVEELLSALREKHREHGVAAEPYAFIKADSGTYGMGIMTVHSGQEVLEMNKKTRHRMDVIKEGAQNTEVIVQEGVPTIDRVEGAAAEPLLYLLDAQVAGGMFRFHAERGGERSLNTPGMRFRPMQETGKEGAYFAACSLIARLATLAAALERYS